MRRGLCLWLLGLAALASCEEPPLLFGAQCNDNTRIAGVRDVAESRCARHGGVRSVTPLEEVKEPGAKP